MIEIIESIHCLIELTQAMEPDQRIVIRLPLREGSTDTAPLESRRIADIGAARIRQLLREERPSFVVADVGLPLQWVSPSDRFDFWKDEVRPRLVEPTQDRFTLDYPGGYCYLASEWRHLSESHVTIVLEKRH